MFKKSRRRIVAAIMTVLVLLWVGTLCVIYASSYFEVSSRNRDMLREHAEQYSLNPQDTPDMKFENRPKPDIGDPNFKNMQMFNLSTFYSVAISEAGELLSIDSHDNAVYDEEELEKIAREIISEGNQTGVKSNLIYRMEEKHGYILVAFMDNTIMQESMTTLFRYTLIFGSIAILALFFLAVYLAKRIVQPLEESYKKQKQFISDAGHDLKTPISVISVNAELLSREIGDNQWLSNIQYESGRMGTLVGQLLELARTENIAPRIESVNLSRLVGGEALPFESLAFENGLTLTCNIADNILVRGNSAQLKQLTTILIDNAVRHSKQGREIVLTLKSDKSYASLSVVNEGDEIPLEHRREIFERFYRMDSARNGDTGHYGLGLAIAKAIMVAHNGNIEVLCYDGKVEFVAHIPLQK